MPLQGLQRTEFRLREQWRSSAAQGSERSLTLTVAASFAKHAKATKDAENKAKQVDKNFADYNGRRCKQNKL